MIRKSEIKLKVKNFGYLRLSKSYEEFFKIRLMGGGDLFSEFAIQLNPNSEDKINIEIEAENNSQLDTIEHGVSNGINSLNATFNYYGIGFAGFNIRLNCGRYHNVDSKPIGYDFPVKEILLRLIDENFFSKSVIRYSTNNNFFDCFETEEYTKNEHFKRDFTIKLPKQFEKSIQIQRNWKAKGVYGDNNEESKKGILKIEIEKDYKEYRPNELAIKFGNSIGLELSNSIINQIKQFIQYVYEKQRNLHGLKITIDIDNEWKQDYSSQLELQPIIWILKTILFNSNNFVAEEENYFFQIKPVQNPA